MDAAGELHNAMKDCLLTNEASNVSIVHDSSGHNWVTGWFVAIERGAVEFGNGQEKAPPE